MFPSLAVRETEANFAVRKQRKFLPEVKNILCFRDTNVAFETYVSQSSHHENNVD